MQKTVYEYFKKKIIADYIQNETTLKPNDDLTKLIVQNTDKEMRQIHINQFNAYLLYAQAIINKDTFSYSKIDKIRVLNSLLVLVKLNCNTWV